MQPAKKAMTGPIVAGVIVLLVVIGLAIHFTRPRPEPPVEAGNLEVMPPETVQNAEPAEAVTEGEIEEPAANEEKSPEKASIGPNLETVEDDIVALAKKRNPTLVYQVDGHRRDWQEITLYAGPEEGKWTKLVHYKWENGKFVHAGDEPFPEESKSAGSGSAEAEAPLTKEDLAGVPPEMRPSEDVALEAALMDVPNWTGKVISHSSDWARVTVRTGPPKSVPVSEVQLQWDIKKQCYDVISTKPAHGQ